MPTVVAYGNERSSTANGNAALRATTFTKPSQRLPPRARHDTYGPLSSASTVSSSPPTSSSSVASISIMKPVKSAPSAATSKMTKNQSTKSKTYLSQPRQKGSLDFSMSMTPFEAHLEDIYAGRCDDDNGLSFFESHGYYDVSEANTVAMFRQNFGMKKQFWDGHEHDLVFYEEMNLDTVNLAVLQVLSVGTLLSSSSTGGSSKSVVKRGRTASGRFQLLDDQGNEIDAEAQYEADRERRMKLKHLDVDEDDLADLAQEQLVLAKAITVIRTEKTRFRKYFYQACSDEMNRATATAPQYQPQPHAVVPQSSIPRSLSIQLPPYSGYLYILKDTIPHVFRSWHKRWVFLDFNTGLAQMYKRSYWKSARGVLDMRSVMSITRMNQSDICVQCFDGRSMLLRSKIGTADADLWVNLLQFARHQMGNHGQAIVSTCSPQLPLPASTTTMASETMMTQITTTTLSFNGSSAGANSLLVSTKLRAQNERSVLEMMAVHLQSKSLNPASPSHSITAA